MSAFLPYEVAVYAEQCDDMVRAIQASIATCEPIRDGRVRKAIISAALLTVAQNLDGNRMPVESRLFKNGGIAESLADLIDTQRGKPCP